MEEMGESQKWDAPNREMDSCRRGRIPRAGKAPPEPSRNTRPLEALWRPAPKRSLGGADDAPWPLRCWKCGRPSPLSARGGFRRSPWWKLGWRGDGEGRVGVGVGIGMALNGWDSLRDRAKNEARQCAAIDERAVTAILTFF